MDFNLQYKPGQKTLNIGGVDRIVPSIEVIAAPHCASFKPSIPAPPGVTVGGFPGRTVAHIIEPHSENPGISLEVNALGVNLLSRICEEVKAGKHLVIG